MINPYNKTVAHNKENLTTEIFHDLLRCGPLRKILLELLELRNQAPYLIDDFRFLDSKTQIRLKGAESDSGGGQPDLVINNEACKLFIEIKVSKNCTLQDSQPIKYLESLEDSNKKLKGCYFILPKGYKHIKVIKERYKKWFSENPKSQIQYKILYWEDLLEMIDKSEIHNQQLTWFCERIRSWMSYEKINFSDLEIMTLFYMKTEFNNISRDNVGLIMMSPIPKIYRTIYELSERVKEELSDCGYSIVEAKECHDLDRFYTINKDGLDILDFGLWNHFWVECGKPLCICVNSDSNLKEAYRSAVTCEIFDHSEYESSVFLTSGIPENLFLKDDPVCSIKEYLLKILNDMT